MANSISTRIADFIKNYPPFDGITYDDLLQLSKNAQVIYKQEGEYFFEQGEKKAEYLYFIAEGVIYLEKQENKQTILVDVCDEGDLFGIRSMLSGKPFVFSARCEEESIVYAFPVQDFKKHISNNPSVALFFAAGLAGGNQKIKADNKLDFKSTSSNQFSLNWTRPLKPSNQKVISIYKKNTLQKALEKMNEHSIGSMIITDKAQKPLGILTDTDIRKRVVLQEIPLSSPITDVMTENVICMQYGLPLSEYLVCMLKNRIRHICIVTGEGKLAEVVSERDIMGEYQNHPVTLSFAIQKCQNRTELKNLRNKADHLVQYYLEQNVSFELTSNLITHINDAVISKAIQLAEDKISMKHQVGRPEFCWLSLGSEGREEQLIRTDQDNALIYPDSELDDGTLKSYYLDLSNEVNAILNDCGFSYCPAGMMASNPKWCKSVSEWKKYFSQWIESPEEKQLLLSSIFFDFRSVYGEEKLSSELKKHLIDTIRTQEIFINFLAKNALKNPAPLSFFKNFMVERTGEHKHEFDLKARAMMPLVDIARVLALDSGYLVSSNTIKRFEHLINEDSKNKELYESALEAHAYISSMRARFGFQNDDTGRFININEMSKLQRQTLRNCFESIYQLQELLTVRYQLNYFRT